MPGTLRRIRCRGFGFLDTVYHGLRNRELAAVHWTLGRYEEARRELETFIGRWPYDAEGLFYYGRTLESLNDPGTAREMYERAIEAVRTAPRYRQRIMAQWSRLAQKQLGRLPKQ